MCEDFKDKVTYEMSGSTLPFFSTKYDFTESMKKWGYVHTTLNKHTDMLIVASEDLGTLKCKKAKKYNIPIYTYDEAFQRKDNLYKRVVRGKKTK